MNRTRALIALMFMVFTVVALHGSTLAGSLLLNLAYPQIVRAYLGTDDVLGPACVRDRYDMHKPAAYAVQSTRFLPENDRTWLMLGRAQWLQGECQAALAAWRTSVSQFSDRDIWARFELARSLYLLGERDQAVRLFREIGAARYLHGLACSRAQAGDPGSARIFYELALDVEPLPEAADALTAIYTEEGRSAQAEQVWQRVAGMTTADQPRHWLALGEMAALEGNWPAARQALERAIVVSDDLYLQHDLHLRLGRVLVQMEDWPEALSVYEKAIELRPRGSSEPYTAVGDIELHQGHYQEAVAWYDRAIVAVPTGDPWPDIKAGQAAIQFNDLAEAERRYKAALGRSAGHFGALYYLGALKYQQGEITEAIGYLEDANSPSPNCNVLNLLIEWYREVGDAEKAHQSETQFANQCR